MSDYVVWTALGISWFLAFSYFEYRALAHPENAKRVTLSRYMATIGAKFPLALFMLGMIVGGLAVHFWWHWGCDISSQGG